MWEGQSLGTDMQGNRVEAPTPKTVALSFCPRPTPLLSGTEQPAPGTRPRTPRRGWVAVHPQLLNFVFCCVYYGDKDS